MTNEEAIIILKYGMKYRNPQNDTEKDRNEALDMAISALSENKGEWIPLKTRPMTEEEATFYRDWAEYGAEIFDCPLPDDGQEVLISYGGYVGVDTFVKDDGCYFEGVDIEDVDAWQPLPEPYKAESEDKE